MDKKDELEELRKQMIKDETLPLKKGTANLVFGVGNSDTKVLFIGESPGYWEDQKGEPFVGNAGKLLDSLLQSIKLAREEVFITNVVHHRPPNNRDPFPEEIASYGKYLDQIIRIIDPKVIVTLGRFSMAKFLASARITSVHGKVHRLNWRGKEIVLVPMYHPAAALRSTVMMFQIKQDFFKLPKVLEEAISKKDNAGQIQLI